MFSDFISYLKDRGLYIPTEIRKLENCQCVDIQNPVIDLLRVKEKHYGQLNKPLLKTVTGLFIPDNAKIFFIQTLPFRKSSDTAAVRKILQNYFGERMTNKINYSIETLNNIVAFYGFSPDFRTYYLSKSKEKIKTIVLAQLTDRQYIAWKLSTLEQVNIGKKDDLQGEVMLKTCEEFNHEFPNG